MTLQELIIFKHKSVFGNAPAHKLFKLVKVSKKVENKPARSFEDYNVEIDFSQYVGEIEIIVKPE